MGGKTAMTGKQGVSSNEAGEEQKTYPTDGLAFGRQSLALTLCEIEAFSEGLLENLHLPWM